LQTKELIRALCSIMTISGQEYRSADKIRELVGDVYDEYKAYPNGNFIFIRHSSSPADGEKPILLLDAHYDEIGMMVTEIKDGGFLRVTSVGGLKSSILLGGEVTIYAKEELYGVVCVTPPHLQKPGDSEKLPAINEIMIDTGFSKEELTEIKTGVSEAVSNSIIHGYREAPDGIVELECRVYEDRMIVLVVRDWGIGIEDVEKARQPMFTTGSAEERSGMGFTVMESFMDRVDVESEAGKGTAVTMTKRLDSCNER